VVGVDGSPASFTALRWALAHAGRMGARVRAIRCWMPVLVKGWEEAITAEPVPPLAEQQARAERELAQVVAAALMWAPDEAGRVALEQTVIRGPAGPTLVAQAADADLLVVGHGRRLVEMLHRSLSWYCVRHASCPVVVIPPAMATRRDLNPAIASAPG
jgi:nucleotide-binding universal stress UspA family protein